MVLTFSAPYDDYKYIKVTVIHGGHWWFLTGVLKDFVIFGINFDISNNHHMSLLSCISIFSSLPGFKVNQEHSHTWRKLMVLTGVSEDSTVCVWYQIWHHESISFFPPELYSNYQLPNMIMSVSRTQTYLKDVDGSWLEFLRIEFNLIWNLTSWINIICHSRVVFKVSAP